MDLLLGGDCDGIQNRAVQIGHIQIGHTQIGYTQIDAGKKLVKNKPPLKENVQDK